MTSTAELLEDVQKTYASQYGLTLIFTDVQGNVLWSIEGENELCNMLLRQGEEILLTEIKKSLNREWTLSRAVIYDVLPGICVAVAPVPTEAGPTYYLWAGVLVEDQAQETVREQLNTLARTSDDWEAVLQNTPVITDKNKQKWLNRANRLAELAALSLQQEQAAPPSDLSDVLFRKAIHSEAFSFTEFSARFLNHSKEIDFIGLAEQRGADVYEITEVSGSGTDALLGITFSPGEGFLGRALLTGERTFWENTERDRRSAMFRAAATKPKSLFCEPIRRQDGSLSLVFGGSFSNRHVSSGMASESRMLTILLEVGLSVQSLRQENTQQLTRLTSLVDICKLMASAPDLRRILFMLVDISINLVEGPFSCVVLKDRENNKIQLVSRGEFNGRLEEYAKDVTKRSRHLTAHTFPGSQEPHLYTEASVGHVIECPLLQGDELFGILCVGVEDLAETQLQEHLAFLQTLSIIGGVSLQLAGRKESRQDDEKVEALHRAVGQFDPASCRQSEEMALLAAEFAVKINMAQETAKEVIQACQLSCYSPEFIRGTFPESRIADTLREGTALTGGKKPENETVTEPAAMTFALVQSYIRNDHRLDAVAHLQGADEALYHQFFSFIRSSHVTETELELSDIGAGDEESRTIADAISNLNSLSPREQEVLSLITEGMNNREIAEELFISDHTVKNHVTKIFQKLEVSDRANAISKVYRSTYAGGAAKKNE